MWDAEIAVRRATTEGSGPSCAPEGIPACTGVRKAEKDSECSVAICRRKSGTPYFHGNCVDVGSPWQQPGTEVPSAAVNHGKIRCLASGQCAQRETEREGGINPLRGNLQGRGQRKTPPETKMEDHKSPHNMLN